MATINFVITANGAGYAETDGTKPIASTEATAVIKNDIVSIVLSDGSSWKNAPLEFCTLNGSPLDLDPRVAIDQLAAAGFKTPSGGSGGGDTIQSYTLNYDQNNNNLTGQIVTNQATFESNTPIPIGDLSSDYRNNGRNSITFVVNNDINISVGDEFNLFNSSNGVFSNNGVIEVDSDLWDVMTQKDNDYISPSDYLNSSEPYADIETMIFANIPINIGGNQIRGVDIEIRRRTPLSQTVPLAIEGRKVLGQINGNSNVISIQRITTRSSGANDNYYVYGYSIFIVNTTGNNITIPSGGTIRVEFWSSYRNPIKFIL